MPIPNYDPSRRLLRSFAAIGAFSGLVSVVPPAQAMEAAPVPSLEDAAVVAVDRFALFVGANNGGDERAVLQYAGADADAVARVMRDIGGVGHGARSQLVDPTPEQLQAAFSELGERVKAAQGGGRRVEFVFYYSGHSDESGLLLGDQHVPYGELRTWVDVVPADVSIAILDSCASGAFTRLKGGTKRAPFLVGASAVKGHAFLASSSADEAAQESDRVGGSFFTHYLVTGLRGAADVDNDRQVTLNEAYRFAFDETLARTETTQGGPQHAAYDIRLSGSGDLVMTDLRETTATVELAPSLQGRVYVRDRNGKLVAELFKDADAGAVRLALEPGTYQLTVDDGKQHWRATVTIDEQREARVDATSLKLVESEATVARGATRSPAEPEAPEQSGEPPAPEYKTIPVNVGIVPPVSTNGTHKDAKIINHWSFDLVWGQVDRLEGIAMAFGGGMASDGVDGAQLSLGANLTGGPLNGAQMTLGFNYAGGPVLGAQLALGANVARSGVRGGQLSLGGNVALGPVHGIQATHGINVAPAGLRGLQASAGINVARETIAGAQVANVNVAEDVQGAQIALVNVATGRVRGAQIGLVNWADEADASIALIGLTRQGGIRFDVFTSDLAAFNLSVRLRARHTYTLLTGGLHPGRPGKGAGAHAGLGFGGYWHLVPDKLWLAVDAVSSVAFPDFKATDDGHGGLMVESLRLTFGAQSGRRFSVWGGPTFNVAIDWREDGTRFRPGYGWTVIRRDYDEVGVRLWPGFVAGVQF
ncbi:MAG: caspase family protein [Myxococcales bacterium FL481]|nr:MAG: caspase family protein [Myxococcales bacterium FL481]